MGMTPEQINAAIFETEQNERHSEEAQSKKYLQYRSGNGEYDGYDISPVKVNDGIIDNDPRIAAYLWIQDRLIVENGTVLKPDNLTLFKTFDKKYQFYTLVYEKTFVDTVAVLVSHIGDSYKVSAISNSVFAESLETKLQV